MAGLTRPPCQNSGFAAVFESAGGISKKRDTASSRLSQMPARLHHHVEDIQVKLNAALGGRITGGQADRKQAGN